MSALQLAFRRCSEGGANFALLDNHARTFDDSPVTQHSRLQLDALHAISSNSPSMPRTLVVAAHPDDEVIGAGSRLRCFADLTLIHVTDGSPRNLGDALSCGNSTREEYARLRREELASVLALCDVSPERALSLNVVDQEASLHITHVAREIARYTQILQPEAILTHAYEGGHPDHDATALAVHIACRFLRHGGAAAPTLLEFASYHFRENRFSALEFLPHDCPSVTVQLSPAEEAHKRSLIECYRSQRDTLALFPLNFERFRIAPDYDFRHAPHQGPLNYERFEWGMTGKRFRTLARAALACFHAEDAQCASTS